MSLKHLAKSNSAQNIPDTPYYKVFNNYTVELTNVDLSLMSLCDKDSQDIDGLMQERHESSASFLH